MARVDITASIKDVKGGDDLRDSVVLKSGLVGMRGMSSVSPTVDVELKRVSSAWVLIDHIFMKVLSMLFTTFLLLRFLHYIVLFPILVFTSTSR